MMYPGAELCRILGRHYDLSTLGRHYDIISWDAIMTIV